MALRILQFSALFAVGYSVDHNSDSGFNRAVVTPDIALSLDLTDPRDVTVQKGQSAVLRCRAKSINGDVLIIWYHNNETILTNSTRWKIQSDGDLYIPKVAGKKSNGVVGEYRCLVRNNAGALLSNVAKLRVASMDRKFSKSPSNIIVSESQPAILLCSIHSTPPADIQWEFNSTVILPHQTRYVPLPNGALLIKKSQISDSGSYRCKATNRILNRIKYSNTTVLTVSAELKKSTSPVFLPLDDSSNITVNLNERITLYCAVMGWPTPTVQWFNEENVMIGNSSILEIPLAQIYHSGNYRCIAYNTLGSVSHDYHVEVRVKPFFNITPVSKSYPSSITARLECQADGVPKPKITWMKDGEPLKFDHRIKMQHNGLVIGPTVTHDSGIYQCIATNNAGTIWSAVQVVINVSQIVNPPHSLKCRSYDATSICLNWKSSLNGTIQGYSIHSFYKVGGVEVAGPDYVTNNKTYQNANGLDSGTNYTFYVRSYASAASDPSDNVTCRTGVTGKRNLDIEQLEVDSVILKWSEISTDTTCDGKRQPYKVQWRRDVPLSFYNNQTRQQSLIVTGLVPGVEYGFRVVSTNKENNNSPWVQYLVPDFSRNAIQDGLESEYPNITESIPPPPTLITTSVSPLSVRLKWTNAVRNSKYFTVCFVEVSDGISCEDGKLLKSPSNVLHVKKLKPNTTYEFRVRTHDLTGNPGPFSEAVIVQTPADVPSPVIGLNYKVVNESTACLQWEAPSYKGSKLKKYIISYTPDINSALEKWINISLPAKGGNNVTALLGNLSSNSHYNVLVRAVSEVGIGKHAFPILVSTKIIEKPLDKDEIAYHQRVGVIIGSILALLCIIICISCILIRRRCIKQRALARARMTASSNYCPAVAHYVSQIDSAQVILQNPDIPSVQENFCLVPDGPATNIPLISATYFDTKGDEEFPNGRANGSAKRFMNGHVHITENPQYFAINNGHVPEKSKKVLLKHLEDSNSNINSSKFHDLQKLFENSKKSNSSSHQQCNPHFCQNECEYCSSCDEVDSSESNKDVSLNTTQLTSLNDSEVGMVNNNRRKSPISGPNG